MMVYGESIWLVLRGAGSSWVRLGASRFWNARFGSSLNIMMLERVSMLY